MVGNLPVRFETIHHALAEKNHAAFLGLSKVWFALKSRNVDDLPEKTGRRRR